MILKMIHQQHVSSVVTAHHVRANVRHHVMREDTRDVHWWHAWMNTYYYCQWSRDASQGNINNSDGFMRQAQDEWLNCERKYKFKIAIAYVKNYAWFCRPKFKGIGRYQLFK